MARVTTARHRAEKRAQIAREVEFINSLRARVDTTAGQLSLIGALVVIIALTGFIEGIK